jgi:FkbM family methyltransferase
MKQIVKSALLSCGLDVRWVKTPRVPNNLVKIGDKIIYTDSQHLAAAYRDYPETNRVSTRLASVIRRFHNDFQAIDIGANCGDTIAFLFDGWSGKVLAIEPDANCQKWLRRNWGDDSRVRIQQVWLSSTSGVANAKLSKTGWNTTVDVATGGNTQIEFKTLDEVLSLEPEFTNVKLIKIDAEGFDGQILLGSRQTLLQHKPAVLFESNMDSPAMKNTDPISVFVFMMGLGYESFLLYDAYGRFVTAVDSKGLDLLRDLLDYAYADGNFGRVYYYDVIAIHNTDTAVKEHILQSERQHRKSL